MSYAKLNVAQIRDFLDYLEAEAMAGVHEHRSAADPHPDFVNAIKDFMGRYGVHIPLAVAPPTISASQMQQLKDGFAHDWRAHDAALRSLRPLFDLVLAVAEGRPESEQSRLFHLAFPNGTASRSSSEGM